jgi:flavin-dependent dehydrogenase
MLDTAYDVLTVGGGIVGLATALRLLQRRPKCGSPPVTASFAIGATLNDRIQQHLA